MAREGRLYTIVFENVTVTAAQDLFSASGSSGKICRVKRVVLGASDTTLQTAQSLRLRIQFMPKTITLGSGGSAPTPQPVDSGDAAASFTAHVNDTTVATTSGTASNQVCQGVHNFAGWDFTLDPPIPFGAQGTSVEGIAIDLLSTVSGTCHFSGTAWIEEISA